MAPAVGTTPAKVPDCFGDVYRRYATANLMLGRYVVFIGGAEKDILVDTVLVYDLVHRRWSKVRVPGTPEIFSHATCVVNQATLYLQGGCREQETDKLYKLEMSFNGTTESRLMNDEQTGDGETHLLDFFMSWTALPSTLLGARADHTLTYNPDTGCLYLLGGLLDQASQAEMLACPEMSTAAGKWVAIAKSTVPRNQSHHSTTYIGQSRMLLIGGVTRDNVETMGVWIFDANDSWTEVDIKGAMPTRLYTHTTTYVTDDLIVVLGGDGKEKEVEMSLDLEEKTWHPLPCRGLPISQDGHSAIRLDQSIFVFGGSSELPWQKNLLELDIELLTTSRQQPQSILSADFTTIVASAKYADASIILDDETSIPVHTVLLGTRCDYFAKLTEFKGTEVSNREIRISKVERPTMLQALSYIYSGALPEKQEFEESVSLFKLADRLGIELLKIHLMEQLLEYVNIQHLIPLLNLANETNSSEITYSCSRYLQKNRKEAKTHDILQQLDSAVVLSVAQSLLTAD